MPTTESLLDQVRILGPVGETLVKRAPAIARAGSCLGSLWIGFGWAMLLLGVLFLGGMLVATLLFNRPIDINGKPAANGDAALFLGLFMAFWIAFFGLWIFASRKAMFNRDRLDQQWRLVLGDDEWIAYRAHVNRVIGRVVSADVDRIDLSTTGRVVAWLSSGNRVELTGPLPPLDGSWLRDALLKQLGKPMESGVPVYPFVPRGDSYIGVGTILRFRLKRCDSTWMGLLVLAGVNLFWNGITGVFVWQAFWGESKVQWTMALFLIPFALIGLVLMVALAAGAYSVVIQSRIASTILELAEFPLQAGARCRALVSQTGPLTLRRLRVRLVCDEEATFGAGTTTRTETKRVRELEVFSQIDLSIARRLPFTETFDLDVPAAVMHSFEAAHNKIKWTLLVHGEPEGWPEFERTFPVVIHPPTCVNER
ncbi:MAG: hypothetical protein EXS05_22370 [Planctomycetaceae bacterium]|nr:hypothetical protein [Planctomycetaceae bacterium]